VDAANNVALMMMMNSGKAKRSRVQYRTTTESKQTGALQPYGAAEQWQKQARIRLFSLAFVAPCTIGVLVYILKKIEKRGRRHHAVCPSVIDPRRYNPS